MNRHAILILLLAVFCVGTFWAGGAVSSANRAGSRPKEMPGSRAEGKVNVSSLTGCVDEMERHYVLVDDRNSNPIPIIGASGFPREGFAKQMGHQVTVRGAPTPESACPAVQVRTIKIVNEPCAPEPTRQQG